MKIPVYLDNHSTTPVDPRVLEAMLPYLSGEFGNAASKTHAFGWRAEEAVAKARSEVASLIGCRPREIIFTSGATESNNLAILGAAESYRQRGNHIITSSVEHHAVLDPIRHLERSGFKVTVLPPDRRGAIAAEQVRAALTDRTILVSIMAANNEIGTLYPISEIGALCRGRGVLLHTDAAQAAGKIPLDVEAMGIDLLSISAHKIYGPKGAGALFVRGSGPRVRLAPLFHGGGHERGLRSGTLNVPGIAGLGSAAAIARAEMDAEAERIHGLRERLYRGIDSRLDGVFLNGPPERRLPGNLNLSFAGVEGESLLVGLKELAVSSGSACTSAVPEPSYVLRAIGVQADLAHASIRFGIGRFNTEEEMDFAAARVVETVGRLRKISSAVRGNSVTKDGRIISPGETPPGARVAADPETQER